MLGMFWTMAALAAATQPLTKEEIAACLAPPSAAAPLDDATRERLKALASLPETMLVASPDDALAPADAGEVIGRTEMKYTLLPIGRAADCKVLASSGSAAADRESCALLVKHLILRPATKGGKPVASRQHIAFSWDTRPTPVEGAKCSSWGGAIPVAVGRWVPFQAFLPRISEVRRPFEQARLISPDQVPKMQGAILVEFGVSAGGAPMTCSVLGATAGTGLQSSLCATIAEKAWLLPATDDHGNFVPTTARVVVRFAEGSLVPRSGKGERRGG